MPWVFEIWRIRAAGREAFDPRQIFAPDEIFVEPETFYSDFIKVYAHIFQRKGWQHLFKVRAQHIRNEQAARIEVATVEEHASVTLGLPFGEPAQQGRPAEQIP